MTADRERLRRNDDGNRVRHPRTATLGQSGRVDSLIHEAAVFPVGGRWAMIEQKAVWESAFLARRMSHECDSLGPGVLPPSRGR
jgi:hypothetical protein